MRQLTRLALGALALAACGKADPFVDIRIDAPIHVQRVEMFAAARCGAERCDQAVAWDLASTKIDGNVFLLDIDDMTVADRLDDGTFRIDLAPDRTGVKDADRLLFVGFIDALGDSQAVAAASIDDLVLPDDVEKWSITLDPVIDVPAATPDVVPPTETAINRLHTWNRSAATLAKCVVFERWRDGNVERDFLVPPDDTDCDDAPSDCDPFWWNQPTPKALPMEGDCDTDVYPVPGRTTHACQLGATVCSEVSSPPGDTCTPVRPVFCLSASMCTDTCRTDLPACIRANTVSHIYCKFPASSTDGPCMNAATTTINYPQLVYATNTMCLPPKLSPLSMTLSPAMTATLGSATMQIGGSSGCVSALSFAGGTGAGIQYGLLAVPLSNGATSVIALEIEFARNTCGNVPPTCSDFVDDNDTVRECAFAAPLPP